MKMMPTLEQLLRVPQVDSGYSFDLSPDGTRLAFSWNMTGAWEIYELSLDDTTLSGGAGEDRSRVITAPPGGKFRPRYSPDGKRLAYALDLDGSESFHIAIFDFGTGQHTDLTPDIAFAHQPNISWSPDGRDLAVLSDAGGLGLTIRPWSSEGIDREACVGVTEPHGRNRPPCAANRGTVAS